MCHNKFYAPSRCAIEIMNGINQDYFYLPFFTQPHEKSKRGKGQFKVTENPKWGSESLLHLSSILWLENILWLFRRHFVALCAKQLLSKIKKLICSSGRKRHRNTVKESLTCYGRESTEGSRGSKHRAWGIGVRSLLCSHSSLCYLSAIKIEQKQKQKNLLNLVVFVDSQVLDG